MVAHGKVCNGSCVKRWNYYHYYSYTGGLRGEVDIGVGHKRVTTTENDEDVTTAEQNNSSNVGWYTLKYTYYIYTLYIQKYQTCIQTL